MGKLSVCCAVVLNLALAQTALAEETTTQLTPVEVAGVIKAVTNVSTSFTLKTTLFPKILMPTSTLQRVR
jgi:hypothetical protein